MAPASPVKGYCMRYDVKKAKSRQCCALLSESILFFVGRWDWKGEVTFSENTCKHYQSFIDNYSSSSFTFYYLITYLPVWRCRRLMWKLWCTQLSVHIFNNCWVQKGILVSPFYCSAILMESFVFLLHQSFPYFSWVCWSCLLPSEVLNSVLPCDFQHLCLLTVTCKLLASRLVSPGLSLGALAYERILAGSLAGWCQCALGLLQWNNQERRGKSASPCEVKALMLKCECFIQMWNGLQKC